jgi:hypothetical protein
LFLNSLDTIDRLRTLVAFFVEVHNTQMPHAAFAGHTPDEMYLDGSQPGDGIGCHTDRGPRATARRESV